MNRKNDKNALDVHYLDYVFARIEEECNPLSELDFETERVSLIDVRRALSDLRSGR